jgi:hypothetical protein
VADSRAMPRSSLRCPGEALIECGLSSLHAEVKVCVCAIMFLAVRVLGTVPNAWIIEKLCNCQQPVNPRWFKALINGRSTLMSSLVHGRPSLISSMKHPPPFSEHSVEFRPSLISSMIPVNRSWSHQW